jgi:hypothetical protein
MTPSCGRTLLPWWSTPGTWSSYTDNLYTGVGLVTLNMVIFIAKNVRRYPYENSTGMYVHVHM